MILEFGILIFFVTVVILAHKYVTSQKNKKNAIDDTDIKDYIKKYGGHLQETKSSTQYDDLCVVASFEYINNYNRLNKKYYESSQFMHIGDIGNIKDGTSFVLEHYVDNKKPYYTSMIYGTTHDKLVELIEYPYMYMPSFGLPYLFRYYKYHVDFNGMAYTESIRKYSDQITVINKLPYYKYIKDVNDKNIDMTIKIYDHAGKYLYFGVIKFNNILIYNVVGSSAVAVSAYINENPIDRNKIHKIYYAPIKN